MPDRQPLPDPERLQQTLDDMRVQLASGNLAPGERARIEAAIPRLEETIADVLIARARRQMPGPLSPEATARILAYFDQLVEEQRQADERRDG